jgi:hypothetical protein
MVFEMKVVRVWTSMDFDFWGWNFGGGKRDKSFFWHFTACDRPCSSIDCTSEEGLLCFCSCIAIVGLGSRCRLGKGVRRVGRSVWSSWGFWYGRLEKSL